MDDQLCQGKQSQAQSGSCRARLVQLVTEKAAKSSTIFRQCQLNLAVLLGDSSIDTHHK